MNKAIEILKGARRCVWSRGGREIYVMINDLNEALAELQAAKQEIESLKQWVLAQQQENIATANRIGGLGGSLYNAKARAYELILERLQEAGK